MAICLRDMAHLDIKKDATSFSLIASADLPKYAKTLRNGSAALHDQQGVSAKARCGVLIRSSLNYALNKSHPGRLLCCFPVELACGHFGTGDIPAIHLIANLAVACHFPDRTQRVDERIQDKRLVHLGDVNRFHFPSIV
jgi:hypothetical protein